jgi:hypothetical protein
MTGAAKLTYATYRSLQDFEAAVDRIVYVEPRMQVFRHDLNARPGVRIISEIFVTGMNIGGVPGGIRLRVESPHYEIGQEFELSPRFAEALCGQTGAQIRMEKALRLVEKYFSKRDLKCVGGILKVEGLLEDLSNQPKIDHQLWELISKDGRLFLQEPESKKEAPAFSNSAQDGSLLEEILRVSAHTRAEPSSANLIPIR